MRGVVTLAAAFVIPPDTAYREVLLLIAFTVVAGTLFLQGLTLPWLARRLKRPRPRPPRGRAGPGDAPATGLQGRASSGSSELEVEDPHGVFGAIRQRIEPRNFAAWEQLGTVADQETPSELYSRVRLEMIEAERRRVLEIRSSGQVASEVVAQVLSMLDVEESMLDISRENRDEVRTAAARRRTGDTCEHLESMPAVETVAEPECGDCLREGTAWVALRAVPRVRQRRLLRLLPAAALDPALPRDPAPGDRVGGARRGLALVLRPPHHRLTVRRDVTHGSLRRQSWSVETPPMVHHEVACGHL